MTDTFDFDMANTFVYDFDEPAEGGRELLGGKGMGLAEMTQMGVPVPAGFTITTDACRAYMREGDLPQGLAEEVESHIARLEARTGKQFGSADDPLLVSVRSGAAISMPGMMDTILNLGLNDEAAAGLAARTGNERFAYDSYRRLIQMFGETVEGIDGHLFETALADLKRKRGVQLDTELDATETSRSWSRRSRRSTSSMSGASSRRMRASSSCARSRRCSGRGGTRAHRCTGRRRGSRTTSARR